MKKGTLALIPPNDESPLVREAIGLADMNRAQMAATVAGLLKLEATHENLSGICAVMVGIVLHEVKDRLPRGEFGPFIKENFGKSHRSANRYMLIGGACLKGQLDSTVQIDRKRSKTFELLTNDVVTSLKELEKFRLDLRHPVVSYVARWVNGRGSYQLMLDYPAPLGGRRERKGKKLTLAEVRAQAEADAFESYETICRSVDRFLRENSPTLLPKSQRLLMASLFGKAKRSLDAVAD